MDKPTPRIDGSMLNEFRGQTVRLVGRVEQVVGQDTVKLYVPSPESPATQKFDVAFTRDIQFQKGKWYDIIARVMDMDTPVRAIDIIELNDDINEKALAGLIKFTHIASDPFYSRDD